MQVFILMFAPHDSGDIRAFIQCSCTVSRSGDDTRMLAVMILVCRGSIISTDWHTSISTFCHSKYEYFYILWRHTSISTFCHSVEMIDTLCHIMYMYIDMQTHVNIHVYILSLCGDDTHYVSHTIRVQTYTCTCLHLVTLR